MNNVISGVFVVIVGFFIFMLGNSLYESKTFTKDIIKFEQRCTAKGGLTLQAYKTGVSWVGCYKNNVELENEE